MREPAIKVDLACGAFGAVALAAMLAAPSGPIWRPIVAALAVYSLVAAVLARQLAGKRRLGWANRITLLRAVITCVLAGALLRPGLFVDQAVPIVGLVLFALALDGLDGWLARQRNESSAFGARFDMEVDAALILVLCAGLWLSGRAAGWVLFIGLMRPAFLAAGLACPWLARPLPERFRRKLVCVIQVGALPLALLPAIPEALRQTLLAGALFALTVSFLIDTVWLFRRRLRTHHSEWRIP